MKSWVMLDNNSIWKQMSQNFSVFLPTKSKITLLLLGVWMEEHRAWKSFQAALIAYKPASHFIPLGLEARV